MPLQNVEQFHAWIERESPSIAAQRAIRCFLVELVDEPWRSPSVPIADLSDQPEDEVRSAKVHVPGEHPTRIWYRHFYASGAIDIIAITSR